MAFGNVRHAKVILRIPHSIIVLVLGCREVEEWISPVIFKIKGLGRIHD